VPAEKLDGQARLLGQLHRATGSTPFGDAQHVAWNEGSARLLTALGVTSPTTQASAPGRYRAGEAYCGALEARETSDVEPSV
jgi:hypothetical protein